MSQYINQSLSVIKQCIALAVMVCLLAACSGDEEASLTLEQAEQQGLLSSSFKQLPAQPLSRVFRLAGLSQIERIRFSSTVVQQTMKGEAYNWQAALTPISYNADTGRLVLQSQRRQFLLWFLEPARGEQQTIYQFADAMSLHDALSAPKPSAKDVANRGWVTYYVRNAVPDALVYRGAFINEQGHELVISKDSIRFKGVAFKTLSYHHGDGRWVGQAGERFLLIFFRKPDFGLIESPDQRAAVFNAQFNASYAVHRYVDKLYKIKPQRIEPMYWYAFQSRVPDSSLHDSLPQE